MSRFLVVDEDSARRLILRSRLSESGHELTLVESGALGLVEARSAAYDAVLVSVRLASGIDGHEVCRRLKAIPERAHLPVVLYDDENSGAEEAIRAYEAGCDLFVARPDLPALEHALRVLDRHRRRVEDLQQSGRAGPVEGRRAGAEADASPSTDAAAALRELASGRPAGVLVVDAEGLVQFADRGACELLGSRVEGASLGSLVPASGLEAFVRDASLEVREGLRFDLPARRGRAARSMTAIALPLLVPPRPNGPPLRVVLLRDNHRRRIAAEALRVLEPGLPRAEAGPLLEAARETWRPAALLGRSVAIVRLREEIARVALGNDPVLVRGERGTGRQRIVRTLHYSSSALGALIEVRCGALSPVELDLELFGSARASGAGDRPGLFHLAQDGTLYLEEVGELPLEIQERLIVYFERGVIERRGGRPERLDVRVIASSSAALEGAVHEGRFLAPLLEHLARHELRVPPLCERLEDVEELAGALARGLGAARRIQGLTSDAVAALCAHRWPGNVPELQACIERACSHARGALITADDLPRALRELAPQRPASELVPRAPAESAAPGTHAVAELPSREIVPVPRSTQPVGAARAWDILADEAVSLQLYERKALLRAIAECGGDKLAAARLLKLGKSTMYRKLKQHDIPIKDPPG